MVNMVKCISLTNKTTRIRNIATLMRAIRAFDTNNGPSFWKTPESRHEKVTVYWCNCRSLNVYRSEILIRIESRVLWLCRDWINGSRSHNFYMKEYNTWDESPFDPDDFEFNFTGDFLDACKLILDIKTIQDEHYGI